MLYRDKIQLVTGYESIKECRTACVEEVGMPSVSTISSGGVIGEVSDDGSIKLETRARGAGMFVFKGMVNENDSGICLEGDISVKPFSKWIIYVSIVLMGLIGITLIMTGNQMFAVGGVFIALAPWGRFAYMKRSNSLYKRIIKKVT